MTLIIGTSFYPATKVQASELGTDVYDDGTVYDDEGYDANGYDADGYNRAGYDVKGYDRKGYDRKGYDIDGYNVNGQDKHGHSSSYYVPVKLCWTDDYVPLFDDEGKLYLSKGYVLAKNAEGNSIPLDYYEFSKKAISSIRKGCGTYKITATFSKKCGNKVITTTLDIVPSNDDISVSLSSSGYARGSEYYDGKVECRALLRNEKSALESCDGIQYVIGKDKDFNKIYAKNTTKLKKLKGRLCSDKKFKVKDGTTCYIKYRVYTVVDGEKLYSKWEYDSQKIVM